MVVAPIVWLTSLIGVADGEYPQSAPVSNPVVVSSAVLTTPTTPPTSPPTRPPRPPSSPACAGAAPAVVITPQASISAAERRTLVPTFDRLFTASPPDTGHGQPGRWVNI